MHYYFRGIPQDYQQHLHQSSVIPQKKGSHLMMNNWMVTNPQKTTPLKFHKSPKNPAQVPFLFNPSLGFFSNVLCQGFPKGDSWMYPGPNVPRGKSRNISPKTLVGSYNPKSLDVPQINTMVVHVPYKGPGTPVQTSLVTQGAVLPMMIFFEASKP